MPVSLLGYVLRSRHGIRPPCHTKKVANWKFLYASLRKSSRSLLVVFGVLSNCHARKNWAYARFCTSTPGCTLMLPVFVVITRPSACRRDSISLYTPYAVQSNSNACALSAGFSFFQSFVASFVSQFFAAMQLDSISAANLGQK